MAALAGLIGDLMLTGIYFVGLAPFAWVAKRAERREAAGWQPVSGGSENSPTSLY